MFLVIVQVSVRFTSATSVLVLIYRREEKLWRPYLI
jgi:hypothetical protein